MPECLDSWVFGLNSSRFSLMMSGLLLRVSSSRIQGVAQATSDKDKFVSEFGQPPTDVSSAAANFMSWSLDIGSSVRNSQGIRPSTVWHREEFLPWYRHRARQPAGIFKSVICSLSDGVRHVCSSLVLVRVSAKQCNRRWSNRHLQSAAQNYP